MAYDILYCALCGKNYNDVNKLITDDDVTLCDVCYDFCAAQEKATTLPEGPSDPAAEGGSIS